MAPDLTINMKTTIDVRGLVLSEDARQNGFIRNPFYKDSHSSSIDQLELIELLKLEEEIDQMSASMNTPNCTSNDVDRLKSINMETTFDDDQTTTPVDMDIDIDIDVDKVVKDDGNDEDDDITNHSWSKSQDSYSKNSTQSELSVETASHATSNRKRKIENNVPTLPPIATHRFDFRSYFSDKVDESSNGTDTTDKHMNPFFSKRITRLKQKQLLLLERNYHSDAEQSIAKRNAKKRKSSAKHITGSAIKKGKAYQSVPLEKYRQPKSKPISIINPAASPLNDFSNYLTLWKQNSVAQLISHLCKGKDDSQSTKTLTSRTNKDPMLVCKPLTMSSSLKATTVVKSSSAAFFDSLKRS